REWLRTRETGADDLLPFRARVTRSGAMRGEMEAMFGRTALDQRGQGRIETWIPASEIEFYAIRLLALAGEILVEEPEALAKEILRRAEEVVSMYRAVDSTEGVADCKAGCSPI